MPVKKMNRGSSVRRREFFYKHCVDTGTHVVSTLGKKVNLTVCTFFCIYIQAVLALFTNKYCKLHFSFIVLCSIILSVPYM